MSDTYKKLLPAEQVEKWVGCRKGALSQAFSPIPQKDVLDLHARVTSAEAALKTLGGLYKAGLVIVTPATAAGLFLSVTQTGREFSGDQAAMMNGMMLMPCLLGISIVIGTKVIQKQQQMHKDVMLQEFRAKLPEHLFK